MRKLLLLLALAAPLCAAGQSNYLTITTNNGIVDASGAALQSGTYCAYATDATDSPIAFQIGGSFQAVKSTICRNISGGTLASALQLANPAATAPLNIRYHVTVTNTATHQVTQYPGVSIVASGSTWDWSQWNPATGVSSIPVNMIPGTPGPTGPTGQQGLQGLTGSGSLPAGVTVTGSGPSQTVSFPGAIAVGTPILPASGGTGAPSLAGAVANLLPGVISPVPSGNMPTTGWTAYHSYGDSITTGSLATTCTATSGTCYVDLIAAATGTSATTTNHAYGGDQACDTVNKVFAFENPGATSTTLETLMIGTNDANNKPIQPVYQGIFGQCFLAAISWVTTPSTLKYTGASFGTPPTNWSTDTTYSQVTGLKSTTNGAVSVWPYTTTVQGQTVMVFYRMMDSNGGVVQIDDSATNGASRTVIDNWTPGFSIATSNGGTSGVGVAYLTSSRRLAGTWNLTATVTSPTGAGNIANILAVAVAPPSIVAGAPSVWAAGPPRFLNDNQQAMTQAYWDVAVDAINQAQQAGLAVHAAPVRSYFQSTATDMTAGQTLHPNDPGHAEVAAAFLGGNGILPARSNPSLAVNLNQGLPYTSTVSSSPYYLGATDGLVVTTQGATAMTVYLPASAALGKRYGINNNKWQTSTVTVEIAGTSTPLAVLSPTQTVYFEMGYPGTWQMISLAPIIGVSADLTQFAAPVYLGSSATLSCASTGVIWVVPSSAAVLTIPSTCTAGKTFYIVNNGTANVTFAGPPAGNATSVTLYPGTGTLLTEYSSTLWNAISGYPVTAAQIALKLGNGAYVQMGDGSAKSPGHLLSFDSNYNDADSGIVANFTPQISAPTPSGTCTPNGYISTVINGTTVHLATCN